MARLKVRNLPDLSHLAQVGAEIAVRVTPKASRNGLDLVDDMIRITVTAVPEAGKANADVQSLLAQALGLAPSRLELMRGATSRDKVFRIL